MAIQNRRGAYMDFDPEKILAGEWATVLEGDPSADDGRSTYLGYGDGIVKRMATYEDMAANVKASTQQITEAFTAGVEDALARASTSLTSMEKATAAANDAAEEAAKTAETVQKRLDAGELTGPKGPAGTIAIGTVSTGAPGSSVIVTNAGTAENAKLNFTIPKGEPGEIENLSEQIVAFSEAAKDMDISSGDSLKTLFGKVLKTIKTFRGKHAEIEQKIDEIAPNSIVPISKGGTGAATAAQARRNLGLGNTSGAVPIANGGTGATNAVAALNNLGIGFGSVTYSEGTLTYQKFPNGDIIGKLSVSRAGVSTNAIGSVHVTPADTVLLPDGLFAKVDAVVGNPLLTGLTMYRYPSLTPASFAYNLWSYSARSNLSGTIQFIIYGQWK